MDLETGALFPISRPQTLIRPIADPQEMREAQEAFRGLVEACMEKSDVLYINSSGSMSTTPGEGTVRYFKNSMWLKVALGFNLDLETLSSDYIEGEDKNGKFFMFSTKVRVTAPNGRFVIGLGSCSSRDPFFSKAKGYEKMVQPQDVQLKSETVAYNRAIGNIVGRREVSAEEIEGHGTEEQPRQQKPPPRGTRRDAPPPPPPTASEPPKGKDRLDSDVPYQTDRDFLHTWVDNALDYGMTRDDNLANHSLITKAANIGALREIEHYLMEAAPLGRPR